jgi:hypothetical protein
MLISALGFICSCTKEQALPDEPVTGKEYYPLTTGKFVVYQVDSVVYTEIPRDTLTYTYLLKEKITDAFTDNTGNEAYRLERYVKTGTTADSQPWRLKEVWMVNAINNSIQVVEDNKRYTKLVFPVVVDKSWNGNAFNSDPVKNYRYDYVDRSESFAGTAHTVLRVRQFEFRTKISYELNAEKYAKQVGLVEKKVVSIFSNSVVPGTEVEQRLENGLVYKQTMIAYGYE